MNFTAGQIAAMIQGTVEGNPEVSVSMIAKIEEATAGTMAFIANPKYEHYLSETGASIVLVRNELKAPEGLAATLIRVEDPYAAFAKLMDAYQKLSTPAARSGKEAYCVIAETAKVSESAYIGAFSYIGAKAIVEDGAQIYPGVFLGDQVMVGKNSILYPGVKVYANCEIGSNVIIHSGVVIGADGFGFAPQADGYFKKVPQLGKVVIEDDVEIGANTTIDRATMGDTHISRNVKIDNLIQIAHNVQIGENTAIAAQAGISGSTKIGKNCIVGGQAGIVGHLEIADGTRINAQSGLTKSVKKQNTDWNGSPAFDYQKALKSQAVFKHLPELLDRVTELEKRLTELTEKQES